MDRKEYIVFSLRLMGYLSLQGIPFKAAKPDLKNPSKNVFFYDDTTALQKHIAEYKERTKR